MTGRTYCREGKRPTQRKPGPRHVDQTPCPAGGLHRLTCDRRAHVTCAGCGATWADLDAELRAEPPPRPATVVPSEASCQRCGTERTRSKTGLCAACREAA